MGNIITKNFRRAAISQRYTRSPSPKGDVLSSRPRDKHQPPKFSVLIPREPEAKWVGSRPGSKIQNKDGSSRQDEDIDKTDEEKLTEPRSRKNTLAEGIKSLCLSVPRKARCQY